MSSFIFRFTLGILSGVWLCSSAHADGQLSEITYVVRDNALQDPSRVNAAIAAEVNRFYAQGAGEESAKFPTLQYSPAPQLPLTALQEHRVGTVSVRVVIEPDGSVSDVKQLTSDDDVLASAVLAAVRSWAYSSDPTRTLPYYLRFFFRFE